MSQKQIYKTTKSDQIYSQKRIISACSGMTCSILTNISSPMNCQFLSLPHFTITLHIFVQKNYKLCTNSITLHPAYQTQASTTRIKS